MCDLVGQRWRGKDASVDVHVVLTQVLDGPGESVRLKPLPPLRGKVRVAEEVDEPARAAELVAGDEQGAWWR
jgi:hypothetical protein